MSRLKDPCYPGNLPAGWGESLGAVRLPSLSVLEPYPPPNIGARVVTASHLSPSCLCLSLKAPSSPLLPPSMLSAGVLVPGAVPGTPASPLEPDTLRRSGTDNIQVGGGDLNRGQRMAWNPSWRRHPTGITFQAEGQPGAGQGLEGSEPQVQSLKRWRVRPRVRGSGSI